MTHSVAPDIFLRQMNPDSKPDRGPDLSGLRIDRSASVGGGYRSKLIYAALVVVVAVILLLLAMKLGMRSAAAVEAVAARSASPSGAGATAVLDASGYVTARRKSTVAAKITGRVTDMLVDEGMRVEAGQVLARLDDAEIRAQLEVDRANREVAARSAQEAAVTLSDAERTLWRNQELRAKGFSTQEDLDRATTAVDAARARLAVTRQQLEAATRQVDLTERQLDNCTVRAPFSGIAISKDAQIGEIVSPMSAGGGFTRTGISTIVDMNSLEIEVDVNESFIARVEPGQVVDAVLDAYPDWHIPAKVRTTIPSADRQKATVKVRISFDALDPRILPDMGIKVSFLRAANESADAATSALVPKSAVREDSGKKIVFVIRDGKAERRAVATGLDIGPDTEIRAGVSPGELVIVSGPEELVDGQKVEIKERTPS